MSRLLSISLVIAAAVGLTVLFWLPLWQGGGFIGGDVYSFYLPQKTFYAEQLQNGLLPSWNNRTGFGYPLIAESQTGVFYPLNLILYSTLEVNTAYNVNHLLHYALAFLFCWMLAREFEMNGFAAGFSALVYVYGWFPARNCLEWAIIGGAWLPAAAWCTERFLKTRRWKFAIGLSIVLALQMLAGHYQIAFMTQVLLAIYVPARLWFTEIQLRNSYNTSFSARVAGSESSTAPIELRNSRSGRMLAVTAAAILFGFALSAVQLLPSWELKQYSQRADVSEHHRLAQGSSPVGYWSQMILPWHWYSPNTDRNAQLQQMSADLDAPTNQVEAHLYFGMIPLGLAIAGVIFAFRERRRLEILWFLLGIGALAYSSGLFIPIARHVPGFNFFQGPGRWGIITTLAVALPAGKTFQRFLDERFAGGWNIGVIVAVLAVSLMSNWLLIADVDTAMQQLRRNNPRSSSPLEFSGRELTESIFTVASIVAVVFLILAIGLRAGRSRKITATKTALLCGVIFFAVTLDLWIVSRLVTESPMIADPPILHRADSEIKRELDAEPQPVRLFAPYPNFPNVLGVSSLPVYLTFGPAVYVDPEYGIPEEPVSQKVSRLQKLGVTHVLSLEPLDSENWPVELLWRGHDRLLNPAMGRFGEPLFLYRLNGSRGRVDFADQTTEATASIAEYQPHRIVIETESPRDNRLVLTELNYPGWQVSIDGKPVEPDESEPVFRTVNLTAGNHTVVWIWHPGCVYWGAVISLIAILLLAAVAHVRFHQPQRLAFLDPNSSMRENAKAE